MIPTYGCDVIEEFPQESDDIINIPILFHKAQTLAPGQFANDIKGKKLQPLTKVAALSGCGKHFLRPVEPKGQGGIDKRLVVD